VMLRILVIGAAGRFSGIVDQLLARGHTVRAMTRDPSSLTTMSRAIGMTARAQTVPTRSPKPTRYAGRAGLRGPSARRGVAFWEPEIRGRQDCGGALPLPHSSPQATRTSPRDEAPLHRQRASGNAQHTPGFPEGSRNDTQKKSQEGPSRRLGLTDAGSLRESPVAKVELQEVA
jgi:hypothetical protein